MKYSIKQLFFLLCFWGVIGNKCAQAQQYLDMWHDPSVTNFYDIQDAFNEHFADPDRDRGRGSGYKQFKRWEAFMEPRVYPSGELINPTKIALDEHLRYQGAQLINKSASTAHNGDWEVLQVNKTEYGHNGSGVGMGRVNCIAFHPQNNDIIFVGTPAGGLWKSETGGNSWKCLTDGLPVLGVSGIAIHPNDPDIIYILTGDGDGSHTPSIGVLKSKDGGQSWKSTALSWEVSNKIYGYKLLMHPTKPENLFVATTNGIYKIEKEGQNTKLVNKEIYRTQDIEFHPQNPEIMYAVGDSEFYKSINGGDRWDKITIDASLPHTQRMALGVSLAKPDYVYVLAGGATGFVGLYRSTNKGNGWNKRSSSPNILGRTVKAPYDKESQASYDLTIAVSPINAEEIHTGGINCWKSGDGGLSWNYTSFDKQNAPEATNRKYTHADIHALEFDRNNKLYCGSDGGIYRYDNTSNWQDLSKGLNITQFYRLGVSDDGHNVMAGAQDNGCNSIVKNNETMYSYTGGDGMECIRVPNSDISYLSVQEGDLYKLELNSIQRVAEQLIDKTAWTMPFVIHPDKPDILYFGTKTGVQRTTDGCTTSQHDSPNGWTNFKIGNKDVLGRKSLPNITMALNTSGNSDVLYVATAVNIRKSLPEWDKRVKTWPVVTGDLPVGKAQITFLAVDKENPDLVWVTFSGYAEDEKVYKTTDGGANWENITGSLPNVPVNCVTYDPQGKGVYVGTDIGVFYKGETIADWVPFRNGMPSVIVKELEIKKGKIYAATFGRGIWMSDLYGDCEATYTLNDETKGYRFYEAGNNITSTAKIDGGIGTHVTYRAGVEIHLKPGFEVGEGNQFFASLGSNCNAGNVPIAKALNGVYEGPMEGVVENTSDLIGTKQTIKTQVYPNPYKSNSIFEFNVINESIVNIGLFDIKGRLINQILPDRNYKEGNYRIVLDSGIELAKGTYFLKVRIGSYNETKKLILQ